MAEGKIQVNRAPVLTLWAAIVAERLGFDRETALTLGKAVAGLNAQSKGRRLGIYEEKSPEEKEQQREKEEAAEVDFMHVMGRSVPVIETPRGLRAANDGRPIHAPSVEKYLKQRFGDDLDAVRSAMEELAGAIPPKELEYKAYGLYEKFRPKIPEGARGWGAKGELDLGLIRSLAE